MNDFRPLGDLMPSTLLNMVDGNANQLRTALASNPELLEELCLTGSDSEPERLMWATLRHLQLPELAGIVQQHYVMSFRLDLALVESRIIGEGTNPWQNIRGVYTAIGSECFFDVIGSFDSRPVPDPRRGSVVWDFDHTVRPVIIGLESELDTSQIVNGWVIKGESSTSTNPVNAFAFDTDPASRYNIFAPPIGIGQRIKRKTFPIAHTTQQCQDIADGSLNNSLGLANTITIGIVPHPGIALGDIARINSPETGVVGRFWIQGYQLQDAVTDQMQLACFRQTDNP